MSEKSINEVDIWTGIISPNRADMPEPSAITILGWSFNEDAKVRMELLANLNNQGELTDSQREEFEAYVHVGQVIGILQAKARLSLKRSTVNGTE